MPEHNSYKVSDHHKGMTKTFHVIIEKDEDDGYVGHVPELRGCHSQGETVDELLKHMREAIELCLEDEHEIVKIVDVQQLQV